MDLLAVTQPAFLYAVDAADLVKDSTVNIPVLEKPMLVEGEASGAEAFEGMPVEDVEETAARSNVNYPTTFAHPFEFCTRL